MPSQIDVLRISTDLQSRFIRQLIEQADVDSILAAIAETTANTLQADACAIFMIDPDGTSATQRVGTGYQSVTSGTAAVRVVPAREVKEQPRGDEKLGLTGWILSTGRPFLACSPEDTAGHAHYLPRPQHTGETVQSFLGVPIRGVHGKIIGVIEAERTAEPLCAFSVGHELALETIARVAARSVAYLDMARRGMADEALTEWARDVIAEAAGGEAELDSYLDIVVKVTAAAMSADSCAIFLIDPSGKTLTQRAGMGSHALRTVIRSYPWPSPSIIGDCAGLARCTPPDCPNRKDRAPVERAGIRAWIAATGKSFHARNREELSKHCHHKGHYDAQNFRQGEMCGAFLGVPLRVGGSIIGVVSVENTSQSGERDSRDFLIDAQQRFDILAQDIALAIKCLEARPARQRIIREAENTIFEILRGGLEIPVLVKKVVDETRELFHAGACSLFLREGNRLVQRPWSASGWLLRGPEERAYDLRPEAVPDNPRSNEKVGLTVWIAMKQQRFTARSNTELTMHPHHRGKFDKYNFEEGRVCESFMGFPLLVREGDRMELVGVLKVENKMREVDGATEYTYFTDLDELVFELIANSAALAIHNARLVESGRTADRELAEGRAREKVWKEFSAMSAHRIGTEAARMGGALLWLEDELRKARRLDEANQHLTRIRSALGQLETFVREFSEFATPPVLTLEPLDIASLCREVKSNFDADFGRLEIRVRLELQNELPELMGDRTKLRYGLTEMFQNAVKAMPRGGELRVIAETGYEWVRIDFIDTGPGIRPEIRHRIFEPGFRDRPGGTGLGLAIVKQTVDEHGGSIREVGTPGTGAHFIIELPYRTGPTSALPPPAKSPATPARILIVDDMDDLRSDLERIVKRSAPERRVVTAKNELEAVRLIADSSFDVVITDIKLDEAGGSETGGLKVIRAAREKDRATPVIVVSAWGRKMIRLDDDPSGPEMPAEEVANRLGCFLFVSRRGAYLETVGEAVERAVMHRRGAVEAAAT